MTVIRRAERLRSDVLALPIDDPVALRTDPRLTSPSVFEIEQRLVLPAGWSMVAVLSSLAESGDFVATTAGAEPVVAIRGRDGVLRALSNACTHRASLLADGEGNCGRTLVCPYHGWTFGLEGRLMGVPYRTGFEVIDHDALHLAEMRMVKWGPFAFVNPSGGAEPIPAVWPTVGDVGTSVREVGRKVIEVDEPWKVLVDQALRSQDSHGVWIFPAFRFGMTDGRPVATRWEPTSSTRTRVHSFDLEIRGSAGLIADKVAEAEPAGLGWWRRYAAELSTAAAG